MECEIPFDFSERVPIVHGAVNGRDFARFLLDTGAPSSRLHKNIVAALGLSADGENTVRIDSLRFGTLDVGPIDLKTSSFGENRLDGLLGTRELSPYCVTLDLDRCLCVLGKSTHGSDPFSPLELFHGRPIVRVQHADAELTFVLDTGSSGNWLFASGQDKLRNVGAVIVQPETAKAAQGNLTVQRRKVVDDVAIGGMTFQEVAFLLSEPDQFGGANAPEDGILGIGAIASSGIAIIDFRLGHFVLTSADNGTQPNHRMETSSQSSQFQA